VHPYSLKAFHWYKGCGKRHCGLRDLKVRNKTNILSSFINKYYDRVLATFTCELCFYKYIQLFFLKNLITIILCTFMPDLLGYLCASWCDAVTVSIAFIAAYTKMQVNMGDEGGTSLKTKFLKWVSLEMPHTYLNTLFEIHFFEIFSHSCLYLVHYPNSSHWHSFWRMHFYFSFTLFDLLIIFAFYILLVECVLSLHANFLWKFYEWIWFGLKFPYVNFFVLPLESKQHRATGS